MSAQDLPGRGMRQHVQGQAAAYRQGVVLGLTMAEIMLLLVFCLLAASGALLARQQQATEKAERRSAELRRALAQNETVLKAIRSDERLSRLVPAARPGGASGQALDESWTRLVAADQAMDVAEQAGLSREAVRDGAPFLAAADGLRRQGVDAAALERDVAVTRALEQALGPDRLARMSPEEVAELARRGLDPSAPSLKTAGTGAGKHDWPPIIRLSEASGYYFPVGSAEVDPGLAQRLRTVIADRLLSVVKAYDVDVIEVIGHTDDLPVAGRASNLDKTLSEVVRSGAPVSSIIPADNAGLGLARAVAVSRVLMQDPRLAGYRILPLSAAQLTGTDERLSAPGGGDAKERRRIEIRVRRSSS